LKNKLEIACFDYDSAITAWKSGANRIEYCHDYSIGGKSPDLISTKKLIDTVDIPVFVMLRMDEGFHYKPEDFDVYKKEIIEFKKIGAHGFVIGFLDNNNEIDELFNAHLLELIKPLPCTFHRAIDYTANYFSSIEKVIDMGFSRILTSGGKGNAFDFLPELKEAQKRFGNKIGILPGGGIRNTNVKEIKDTTGCNEFHSAAFVEGKINTEEIKKLLSAIA
jgi:copper homeostasis protein